MPGGLCWVPLALQDPNYLPVIREEKLAKLQPSRKLDHFLYPVGSTIGPMLAGSIQSLPLVTIIGYQVLLRGALEAYLKISPWYSPLDDGGYFDPMGLNVSSDVLTFRYVQEVKRGRIAMFGMLGYHLQAHIDGGVSPDIWAAQVANPYGAHGLLHYEQFLPTPLVAFCGFKNINKWLAPKLPTFTTVPLPTLLAPRPGIDCPHQQFTLQNEQEPTQIFVRNLDGTTLCLYILDYDLVMDLKMKICDLVGMVPSLQRLLFQGFREGASKIPKYCRRWVLKKIRQSGCQCPSEEACFPHRLQSPILMPNHPPHPCF